MLRARAMAALSEQGPSTGSVAATGCDGEAVGALKTAVNALRQLRLCTEGREEAVLTHLIVGAPGKRTLKTLVSKHEPVATGTWVVDMPRHTGQHARGRRS